MTLKVFVCVYVFKLIYIYIFYIKDELREKISEKLSIPPYKQHFLNWTMRSYDDRVGNYFDYFI